jgi:hypothetical protein
MISHFSESQSAPDGRHVVGARDPLPAVRGRALARLYLGGGFLGVAAFRGRR